MKDVINQGYIMQRVGKEDTATGSSALRLAMIVQDSRGSVQNTTSLRGRHIECMYKLTEKAEMDGNCMCCAQPPALSREVTIYPVQLVGLKFRRHQRVKSYCHAYDAVRGCTGVRIQPHSSTCLLTSPLDRPLICRLQLAWSPM